MWADMSAEQRRQTLRYMMAGADGMFWQSLATAWYWAAEEHAQKLADAFPDFVARYAAMGPAQ